MKIENLKEKLSAAAEKEYRCALAECAPEQLHNVLSGVIMDELAPLWEKSREVHDAVRKASYLSMEFLVGRAVYNNLLCLDLLKDCDSALSELGTKLSDMEEIEDAALGNGGLGRLAACFLDSAATLDLPMDGYGIRYKYGLFKQGIKDGFQTETADNWQKYGDPWGVRCERDAVEIKYGDCTVTAVPYDYPVIGYGTDNIGTLRLWQAEASEEFDFDLFNSGRFTEASEAKRRAEDISRVLYPNDETREGKKLRLRQEYFFSAAAVADLVRKHKARFGSMESFAQYNAIQMNDTHPVIALPEFIRILVREEGYSFDKAFDEARKVFAYTNHTIMQEALEKWEGSLIEEVVPDVFAVILMINERFEAEMHKLRIPAAKKNVMKIINGGTVHMANIAVFGSSYVNGVAQIHSDLLKTTVLKEWYEVYPERFQNKTNGITQRRWLALCNSELSALITELLGDDGWITDLDRLKGLEKYADDESVLRRFIDIKHEKKVQLAQYIEKCEGISINTDAVFDIQIKRLHEYKRQLLNALSILYLYYEIKDGNIKDFTPTVFIFGAKAAPGYYRAKGVIKLINEIADIVNNDPDTRGLIQVVFISNYRVTYAEKLVAACDVSEQISTAGTEASGTGNMKLMLNGAVTLGTMDGANVEIVEEAGEENNYIFGARVEELEKLMPDYDPREVCGNDPKIKRVLDALIDGTVSDGGNKVFRELYFSLMEGASWHRPDHYYVLGDLDSYVKAKLKVNADYRDSISFARKCWMNIANAGKFSSDRTIAQYAEEIWHIKPLAK
ncbi:MAG: glycogen/starch/alpha-glucan phosphorylase [Oscillospiraceae bacterium]